MAIQFKAYNPICRLYDKQHDKFIFPDTYKTIYAIQLSGIILRLDEKAKTWENVTERCVVQQYIGRKDKKGKMIYAGDIIEVIVRSHFLTQFGSKRINRFAVQYETDICGYTFVQIEGNDKRKPEQILKSGTVVGNIVKQKQTKFTN